MVIENTKLLQVFIKYPLPERTCLSYGTAGFRAKADLLSSTVFRMGVLAALRALQAGGHTGLMITASHNPIEDNGIKISDPEGHMLDVTWEPYANRLASAATYEEFKKEFDNICEIEGPRNPKERFFVFLARDTRPSGELLANIAKEGISLIHGVQFEDLSILTTPQLHWLVRTANQELPPVESTYFKNIISGLQSLLEDQLKSTTRVVVIDGAYGVGAQKLKILAPLIQHLGLEIEIRNDPNDGSNGVLNLNVGADFVQKEKKLPLNFDPIQDFGKRCVSLDGDADRLVYFYFRKDSSQDSTQFRLLDGDKIAILLASFLAEQLEVLSWQENGTLLKPPERDLNLGVVQTAYANGASSRCLDQGLRFKIPRVQSPTGVKHLHKLASEFDCGLYFEANGHGTVLFKETFLENLKERNNKDDLSGEEKAAIRRILAVSELANQAVGDALSGVLLVEALLLIRDWSIEDWDSMYEDMPSRQLKVKVPNRAAFKTTFEETQLLEPTGLQEEINSLVSKFPNGRSFVRPSGTEDVVRIYSEADSQEEANSLAAQVAQLVEKWGIGGGK